MAATVVRALRLNCHLKAIHGDLLHRRRVMSSEARKVREEDREYYRTHKPSPLAEVEFADTRKPITRATDSGAADVLHGRMVQDTADDSLARAEAMFREAASRGNPEWPHSRALAEMLARRKEAPGDSDAP